MGLLDAFWETKGYVAPAEFRQYNNTTVPLARLKDRVYTTAQTLTVPVELAHFGPAPLPSTTTTWRIVDAKGRAMASGALPARDCSAGQEPCGGHGRRRPFEAACTGGVSASWSSCRVRRSTTAGPSGCIPHASADRAAPGGRCGDPVVAGGGGGAGAGGKVLFLSGAPEKPSPDLAMSTVPIFWNRLMNPSRTWMLGLWCDAKHPALAGFPTESNCDWQWVDLLPHTTALNVDTLAARIAADRSADR